jgi:hypothetical protein
MADHYWAESEIATSKSKLRLLVTVNFVDFHQIEIGPEKIFLVAEI